MISDPTSRTPLSNGIENGRYREHRSVLANQRVRGTACSCSFVLRLKPRFQAVSALAYAPIRPTGGEEVAGCPGAKYEHPPALTVAQVGARAVAMSSLICGHLGMGGSEGSERRESNPRSQLGKLMYCLCTTLARRSERPLMLARGQVVPGRRWTALRL